MADKEAPKNLGQENRKPAWLAEVEDDAVRITLRRMREAEEDKKVQEEKAKSKA